MKVATMYRNLFAGLAILVMSGACLQAASGQEAPGYLEEKAIAGRPVVLAIPENPRAIIYLFHGTGGSENFATNATTQRVLKRFVAAGYGYVATSSAQRTGPARWQLEDADPSTNADLRYMVDLHRHLVRSGAFGERTPIFSMGMSNGGGMANLFGLAARKAQLPMTGVADYLGPFPAAMLATARSSRATPPPTFVVVAENDGLVDAERVLAAAGRIAGAGIPVETHVARETLVQPGDFMVIAGVEASQSQTIFDDLVSRGIIDRTGKRLVLTDHESFGREAEVALQALLPPGDSQRLIHRVLVEKWAGHVMRSDFAAEQFAFFEAALAGLAR